MLRLIGISRRYDTNGRIPFSSGVRPFFLLSACALVYPLTGPKESNSVYDLVKICVDRAWKNDYNEIEPGVVRFGI